MSFHLSIIASGRTAAPAASVGFSADGLKCAFTGGAEKTPVVAPKDLGGLMLERVLATSGGVFTQECR